MPACPDSCKSLPAREISTKRRRYMRWLKQVNRCNRAQLDALDGDCADAISQPNVSSDNAWQSTETNRYRIVRVSLVAVFICACTGSMRSTETVVDGRAITDERHGTNWLSSGRTYAEHHFSPLADISTANVKQLGLAWFLDLPRQGPLQATPLAVDGVLYFSGVNGKVFSVNASNGRLLWEFDPDLARHAPNRRSVLFGSNRGVALWRGKVYVGTVDGRLVALNSRTGQVVWSRQTFDEPNALKIISGAPRVFNGKVIIGHAGERGTRGYVTTYDAESGEQLWRFYTVPGDPAKGFENTAMEMAAKSWNGEWWKLGGNATVWDTIVYDPDFNRVYFGTANGTPVNANVRGSGGGDNLFVASIVAVDADTGNYVWHYQINPGESWEYDATQQIVLADLTIGGNPRKVLMQASKNGFFYVIDRGTGTVISAEKIGKVTWAERIDLKTGHPVEAQGIRYKDDPVLIWPSSLGAHNWQRMSFNLDTGLVYIPTMKLGMLIGPKTADFSPRDPDDGTGALLAWDPIEQKKRWEVHYPDSFWNGGTLTTRGNLVFHGTGRGQLIAYDARTGDRLWSFYAGLGINAAPMTYAVDGTQYVSVLVGYGGTANVAKVCDYGWHYNEQPRRLLTFALEKKMPLPPGRPPRFNVNAINDPAFVIDLKQAAEGAQIYNYNCGLCHGRNLENIGSFAPDLRESALSMNWEAFKTVLHGGALAAAGMPKFEDLSDKDMHAIYMYIRQRAREAFQTAH
jgi:quinohemoprotein ethanol dehydrogenase